MPNLDKTDITIVLDRSGSMAPLAKDMEGSMDKFFEEQRKLPGECFVTMYQFNTTTSRDCQETPISAVPKVQIVAQGGTALLDALGLAMTETGNRLRDKPEATRAGKVLFVIITDGEENSSHEYSQKQIKDMTKHQQDKYAWEFIYLGANQDAIKVAAQYGITRNAVNWTASKSGAYANSAAISSSVGSYRGGRGGQSLSIGQADYDNALHQIQQQSKKP